MKQLFFILLFLSNRAGSQDLRMQEQIENLAAAREDELQEDDQLLQQMDYFRKNPLNLNTATTNELQQLRILTEVQINYFISYRQLLGKLVSIYEMQAIPSWDLATIRKLLPFIRIGPAVTLKENFLSRFKGNHSFLFRVARIIEKPLGYRADSGNHYPGDANHLLFRYRYQYKDLLYFGVVGDKDAGEQFFRGAQSKGFDFYSVHFFARELGIVQSLAIGDYTVNLGQGLVQWQSLGFGKSSEAIAIKRQSPVLLPYRAAGEFNFNRGAGVTLKMGNFEATAFASFKKLSGKFSDDTIQKISSFQTSGYHRTVSEIAGRYRIGATTAGGKFSYRAGSFYLGLNAVLHQFDKPVQKADEPYHLFAFAGKRILNTSIDHGYTYKNVHLFGEVAIDKNKNPALVQGIILSLDSRVDVSLFYRNISMAYQSIYGSAFTEASIPSNEKGIYSGISIRPYYGWTINAYVDYYRFPWLRYRMNAPAVGTDYLLQVIFQPNRQTELFARYRCEGKPVNSSIEKVKYPQAGLRRSLRIHSSSQLNRNFIFRSRMEMLWYSQDQKKEEGCLGYVEMVWQADTKLKCISRFQYAEAGSFDSRIYVYESDVLYSFSIPAFYDKGIRYYLTLNYDYNKNISCWLRVAQMQNRNKEGFGSGPDLIHGRKKSEIKFQVVVNL